MFIQPFLTTQECTVADLNHSWNGTHQEYDGGKMDGFTAANVDPLDLVGQPHDGLLRPDRVAVLLRHRQSVLDRRSLLRVRADADVPEPVLPAHAVRRSGTSGTTSRPQAGSSRRRCSSCSTRPRSRYKIYLTSAQVEQLFSYVQKHSSHVVKMAQYYKDAAAGKLPQVAFVESDPFGDVNHESDEHPSANVQVGQKLTHDVMQALVKSPNWKSSAMFLTYDEHGGYYDHVAPPAAPKPDNIAPMLKPGDTPGAFDRYGIRVPALVISPYAKTHFVSHTVYDHTSILRLHRDPLRAPEPDEARQGRQPDARHVRLHQGLEPEADAARRAHRPRRRGRLQGAACVEPVDLTRRTTPRS